MVVLAGYGGSEFALTSFAFGCLSLNNGRAGFSGFVSALKSVKIEGIWLLLFL